MNISKNIKYFLLKLTLICVIFLFCNNLDAQSIKWEFPEKEVENLISDENDEIWFQASHNDLPNLFKTDRAKFGPAIKRFRYINSGKCKIYDGIIAGPEGCTKNNYAVGAENWSESQDDKKYIQVSFTVENMPCYNLGNLKNKLKFDYKSSGSGPRILMIKLFIENEEIELINNQPHIINSEKWGSVSYDLNVSYNGESVNLLYFLNENNKKIVKIRFYGYHAYHHKGTLRLDNIDLDFSGLKASKPTLSDIKVKD